MNERMNQFLRWVVLGAACLAIWRQTAQAAGDSAPGVPSTAADGDRVPTAPRMAATSLTTLDGKTYSDVTVQRADPDGLLVFYTPPGGGMGVAKLKFRNLPDPVRQQYGYDAQRAVEFERQQTLGQVRGLTQQSRSQAESDRAQPERQRPPAKATEQARTIPNRTAAPRTTRRGDSIRLRDHRATDFNNSTVAGGKGSMATGGPMGGSIETGNRGGPMGGSIVAGNRGGPMGGTIGTGSSGGPMGGGIETDGKGGKTAGGPMGGSNGPRR